MFTSQTLRAKCWQVTPVLWSEWRWCLRVCQLRCGSVTKLTVWAPWLQFFSIQRQIPPFATTSRPFWGTSSLLSGFGKAWSGFSQSLQANAGVVHRLGHYRLLPNPFKSSFRYRAVIDATWPSCWQHRKISRELYFEYRYIPSSLLLNRDN
jgi:hypothetical protein